MGEKRIVRVEVESRIARQGTAYLGRNDKPLGWWDQMNSHTAVDALARVLPDDEALPMTAADESCERCGPIPCVHACSCKCHNAPDHDQAISRGPFENEQGAAMYAVSAEIRDALRSIAASERVRAKAEVMRGANEAAKACGMLPSHNPEQFELLLKELP